MPGWINVPVRIETRNRLDAIKLEQSYDSVINDLMDLAQTVNQNKKEEVKE